MDRRLEQSVSHLVSHRSDFRRESEGCDALATRRSPLLIATWHMTQANRGGRCAGVAFAQPNVWVLRSKLRRPRLIASTEPWHPLVRRWRCAIIL